jgi:hypothetical protein
MGRAAYFSLLHSLCISSRKKQNTKKYSKHSKRTKKGTNLLNYRAKRPNTRVTFGSIPFIFARRTTRLNRPYSSFYKRTVSNHLHCYLLLTCVAAIVTQVPMPPVHHLRRDDGRPRSGASGHPRYGGSDHNNGKIFTQIQNSHCLRSLYKIE